MINRGSVVPEIERRTEVRCVSAGQLLITVSSTEVVLGRLLNVSRHGFCITHNHPGFRIGQEVRARAPWADVPARVVWVGAQEDEILTGFRTDRHSDISNSGERTVQPD